MLTLPKQVYILLFYILKSIFMLQKLFLDPAHFLLSSWLVFSEKLFLLWLSLPCLLHVEKILKPIINFWYSSIIFYSQICLSFQFFKMFLVPEIILKSSCLPDRCCVVELYSQRYKFCLELKEVTYNYTALDNLNFLRRRQFGKF